jgi:hypothetical protein
VGRLTVVFACAVALVGSGVALAAHGDPQKRHTKADMARAKSVVLRPADLGAGWKATPSTSANGANVRCKKFDPDESDLVETGVASSPDFSSNLEYVSSYASLFKTSAQAQTGWNRIVKPGLLTCLQTVLEQGSTSTATISVTGKSTYAFPKVAARTAAFRLSFSATNGAATLKGAVDIVLLGHGRIDAALLYVAFGAPSQALERRLAGIIASRIR